MVSLVLAMLLLPLITPPALAQAAAKRNAPTARGNAMVSVNFVNADIEAVTRAMGAMLNRQILVDPRVKGTITVYSEQAISIAEAYQQYQAALRGMGFALVESAGLLRLLPEADAKLQAGTVSVGAVAPRGDQVITQIFRLSHENPNNLVAVLRPLISPNNTINANPGNSTLVITDYAENLARLGKIIAALDQPAATDVEVVPLQHAIAGDMAALVQKLGDGASGGGVPGAPPGGAGGVVVMADPRSNALIVRAANPARLASLRTLIKQLDRPGLGGPAGTINVVYLRNADATKLAAVLRAAFAGGASGGGAAGGGGGGNPATGLVGIGNSPAGAAGGGAAGGNTVANTPVAQSAQPSTGGFIQADPATNSLVISAPDPLYRQIRSVIDQLDGRRAQVFVESMIVEMDANKAAEMGFQWQGLLGKAGDKYGVVAGTNYGSGGNNLLNLSVGGVSSTTGNSTSLTLPGSGLNIGLLQRINGIYTLGALARFLETVGGTNILSTPNLVALDNEEAKIVVGQNVPFVTGSFTNTGASGNSVNPFQTVERKDVGLTLKVKPQVGEGGVVRMTIYQENSSVQSSGANGPTTNKNALETTVVADDGQIMVLGGQMVERYVGEQSKVPLLGDAPFIGGLFRGESRIREKKMLLVFLRPTVMRDAQASQSLSLDRYEAIRASQQSQQPEASRIMRLNDAPVLPALPGTVPAQPAGSRAVPPAQPPQQQPLQEPAQPQPQPQSQSQEPPPASRPAQPALVPATRQVPAASAPQRPHPAVLREPTSP